MEVAVTIVSDFYKGLTPLWGFRLKWFFQIKIKKR